MITTKMVGETTLMITITTTMESTITSMSVFEETSVGFPLVQQIMTATVVKTHKRI